MVDSALSEDASPRIDAMVNYGRSTSPDESSSSGSSLPFDLMIFFPTIYFIYTPQRLPLFPFCVLMGSLLSFSTPLVPIVLLGVCDVDPARYCVELREADGYNIR